MTPPQYFILALAMTLLAACWQFIHRRRHILKLRALAGECRMHFSCDDRFRLAPRVVGMLGVPGAAAVRVSDLFYGLDDRNCRYIFRADYTTGVLRSKVSVMRVAAFCEPRDVASCARGVALDFASPALPLVEQYRELYNRFRPAPAASQAAGAQPGLTPADDDASVH